jgi:WD40 repeat protein
MTRFAFCLALVACSADEAPPAKPRVELPGTLLFMQGSTLVRYNNNVSTPIARDVYPSAYALPDGRIVAIASRGDGESGEQLALVSPGGRITRLGPVAAQIRDPAVTTDGIVVAMNVDGHSDLYRIALDGETSRLTNDAAGNFHPIAAGNDIVYVSSRDGDAEIYRGSQRLTAFHKDDFDPVSSPDGATIVFASDREGPARLFVMASDGTQLRRLTDRTEAVDESDAVFSRDGALLAYVAGGRVFVRDAETETEVGSGILAAFSPDGKWLAIARHDGDLVVVPLRGGEPIVIAQGAQLPRWF